MRLKRVTGRLSTTITGEKMVVEMLLLLLLIWSFMTSKSKTLSILDDLSRIGLKIVQASGHRYPQHRLQEAIEGPARTVRVRDQIPLILLPLERPGDQQGSRYYNSQTQILVYIHEISHLLSQDGHGPQFQSTEKRLRSTALALGLITPESRVEVGYPCHQE